jgi:hypothetical protein
MKYQSLPPRHHGGRGGIAGRPGIVDPLDGVRRAGLAGEIGRPTVEFGTSTMASTP